MEETKKEYIDKFTEDGSYKVQANYLTVWEWIEQKLTKSNEEAVRAFAEWFAGRYFSNIESSVSEYLQSLDKGEDE